MGTAPLGSDRPVPRLNDASDAHDPWIAGNLGRGAGAVVPNPGEVRFYAEAGLVWEDERHVLSVATRRREIAILRFGRGDDVERASPVSRFEPLRPPHVLATQP